MAADAGVQSSDGGIDLVALVSKVAQLEQRIVVLEATDCPTSYVRDSSVAEFTLCTKSLGGSLVDEVVRVGDFWIDRFELSNCSDAASLGPAPGHSVTNAVSYTRALGCSRKNVAPQANITWFQAAQMCANAGKTLCSNLQWQTAVSGTVDPGDNNGSQNAKCNTKHTSARLTGGAAECRSRFGAEDMIGNVWEWVAEWHGMAPGTPASTPVSADYGNDWQTSVTAAPLPGDAFPGATARGGNYEVGAGAGAFAVNFGFGPSAALPQVGARCCQHHR